MMLIGLYMSFLELRFSWLVKFVLPRPFWAL
uniref:Uncharacterized protein n=1 Tax=Anguilla anguilla TaxID=7936 RepID=A0A0E9P5A1_ANGAN